MVNRKHSFLCRELKTKTKQQQHKNKTKQTNKQKQNATEKYNIGTKLPTGITQGRQVGQANRRGL